MLQTQPPYSMDLGNPKQFLLAKILKSSLRVLAHQGSTQYIMGLGLRPAHVPLQEEEDDELIPVPDEDLMKGLASMLGEQQQEQQQEQELGSFNV